MRPSSLDWYYKRDPCAFFAGEMRGHGFSGEEIAQTIALGDTLMPVEDFDAMAAEAHGPTGERRFTVTKFATPEEVVREVPPIPQRELDALVDVVIERSGPNRQISALMAFVRPWNMHWLPVERLPEWTEAQRKYAEGRS